jgi:hypothetical protein
MKRWRVGLCCSGYVRQEVEAESEREAVEKASKLVGGGAYGIEIGDWDRWPEADTVEER